MHIDKEKAKIRADIKVKLKDNFNKREQDEKIFNSLIKTEYYKKAKKIFSYVSFNGEVDTHRIIKYALSDSKRVFVPYIIGKTDMYAVEISSFNELQTDKFNILSAPGKEESSVKDFDIIIIPGIAFDREMNRLGRGGGYFDRFLSKYANSFFIGLAFDFQLVTKIPVTHTDIKMDIIITDKEIIKLY